MNWGKILLYQKGKPSVMRVERTFPREIGFIQSAVNYSEGCRSDIIEDIVRASEGIPEVVIADYSADVDHNRMVVTYLGLPDGVAKAILAGARAAVERIDLRRHIGVHPRLGAVDVIPLTPIADFPMETCISLAEDIGSQLAEELNLPVFFYERNARRNRPQSLPEIRAEVLRSLERNEPLHPDRGPSFAHPTAGCTVLGAREPLVAWNVTLKTNDLTVAKRIAKEIRRNRDTIPELEGVRSLGMQLTSKSLTQVSMNLTRPERNSMPWIFRYLQERANRLGVEVGESEIIGLIPLSCLKGESPSQIAWTKFSERQIIDNWIR